MQLRYRQLQETDTQCTVHALAAGPAAKKYAYHPNNRDERHSFRGTTRNSPKTAQLKSAITLPVFNGTTRRTLNSFPFRRRLMGESPALHISGSHHPALSLNANQHKAAQSMLLTYLLNHSTKRGEMQDFFGFLYHTGINSGQAADKSRLL